MRLTAYTDYALRLLMLLALKRGQPATIKEAAERYGISRNHLMKVAHQLGRAGVIQTTRGRSGGLRLAQDPAEISVGAVVRITEEPFSLVECFDKERNACVITPACRLQKVLGEALDAFLAVLDGYTLADLTARPQALRRLLRVATGS